jgi:Flp pilus assembly protein TadD
MPRPQSVSSGALLAIGILSLTLIDTPSAPRSTSADARRQQKLDQKREKQERQREQLRRARKFIQDGRDAEVAKDFVGAQANYADAQSVFPTREGARILRTLNESMRNDVRDHIADAHKKYRGQHFEDAIQELHYAQTITPGDRLLCYDLAVTYRDSGDRPSAVAELDNCLSFLPQGKDREELETFRGTLITPDDKGTNAPTIVPNLRAVNASLHPTDGEFASPDNALPAQQRCSRIWNLNIPSELPTLLFDKMQCAEATPAGQKSATRFLQDYLRVALGALDREQEQAHLSYLQALASMPDPEGTKLRTDFAEATRYLAIGRDDRAEQELLQADSVAPNYAHTSEVLAQLYRERGDVEKARTFLNEFLNRETRDLARRDVARKELALLDADRVKYDDLIEDARAPELQILLAYLANGSRTLHTFVLPRLQLVIRDLNEARSIFPKGIEACDLLALMDQLIDNDWRAKRSFDVLWGQHQPVIFFTESGERVEIWPTAIRVRTGPWTLNTLDDLGRRKELPEVKSGNETRIETQTITSVKTKESSVLIQYQDRSIALAPSWLAVQQEKEGPLVRVHTNEYTKLFRRYAGIDDVKLGPETLSKKEMLIIGFDIMAVITSAYNIGNAVKMQDVSNLITYAPRALAAAQRIRDITVLMQERQRVFQSPGLKPITVSTLHFDFRDVF